VHPIVLIQHYLKLYTSHKFSLKKKYRRADNGLKYTIKVFFYIIKHLIIERADVSL
ncbi:MAG: hypothetical protein ACI92E_000818, partial [Oceanicoccus sp.]